MSKLNLLVSINSYEDAQSSNNPSRSFLKWTREINGLALTENSTSRGHTLAAGETKTLLDNTIDLADTGVSWEVQSGNVLVPDATVDLSDVKAGQIVIFDGVAYQITSKSSNTIFFANATPITPQVVGQILVYSGALSLIYIESNKNLTVAMNISLSAKIQPFISTTGVNTPGMLLNKATVWKLEITNDSQDAATIYFAGVE